MLNKSDKSGHPFHVPDFRGKAFSLSPLTVLAVGFSYMTFITWPLYMTILFSYMTYIHMRFLLRYLPSISSLLSIFYEKSWILLNAISSVSINMILWFFFFRLLTWRITLIFTEPAVPIWNKPHLVIVYNSFYMLLDLLVFLLGL